MDDLEDNDGRIIQRVDLGLGTAQRGNGRSRFHESEPEPDTEFVHASIIAEYRTDVRYEGESVENFRRCQQAKD